MRATIFTLALALAPLGVARAQDAPDPDAVLRQRKKTALTKGVRWLAEQQQPDGSWAYENAPLQLSVYPMTQGVTALCAFALLKCGVEPADPVIEKAFAFIRAQELQHTYSVSCVLLAIEAKTNYEPPPEEERAQTGERRRAPRGAGRNPQDIELARRCVEFLRAHQQVGLWRYPSGSQEDVSNTQYALLALDAAERLGINVPKEVYEKVALRLLEGQEKEGDPVPQFPVPGADRTFRELKKIQQELENEIRTLERRFRKDPAERDKEGKNLDDHMQTAERGAARRILESNERRPMHARGWAYFLPGTGGQMWQTTTNGSMTASAVAALFICKAQLEGTPRWERELKPRVDQALRDGCAWLAKNYSVTSNPGADKHLFYYLYGFERAGILGLIGRFGEHDWYQDGCELFLARQDASGMWSAGFQGTSGPVPDTCFGLLFLARGTTPVIKVPRRVMTGGDNYGRPQGGGR
ncbi:MAG: terpene cyclase/mutase family protein [Planctomycetota bacterium]|nr:terpene cyclase/mutase family protein [Planctomycetota bacterium]